MTASTVDNLKYGFVSVTKRKEKSSEKFSLLC